LAGPLVGRTPLTLELTCSRLPHVVPLNREFNSFSGAIFYGWFYDNMFIFIHTQHELHDYFPQTTVVCRSYFGKLYLM
jgi:hypothetical protein